MTQPHEVNPYRNAAVAFASLHGKADHVRAAFADILGALVVATDAVDTDQFGTFAGDVRRTLTPLAAARAKAQLGMRATGLPYGLASEASYGPLPGIGISGHEEILLFIDGERGLEIIEGSRSLITPGTACCVSDFTEIESALAEWGFPAQGLICRPAVGGEASDIVKGITTERALRSALAASFQSSVDGRALVEPDLRAHHNPTRQAVLTQLGLAVAQRLSSLCPMCASPGFGRTGTDLGLPCSDCGTPTDLALQDIYTCPACAHRQKLARPSSFAEPLWCPRCNP
ncbi:hypothetical protein EH165_09205 [Nakamurella antarctica]|uniref:DUF6671 domain-containing protein n=1 Tax=Nakamurella antarctica TaxID=1902245 RepID=A0A3G8ZMA7_9ACTN|nr:DUF6671 family protein [Nakamurella antarctica]AZI58288.1 hypothetical protein EH165_09205 [Nakamurella antarctica]